MDSIWQVLLDIVKYTLPALIVFLTAYYVIKSFLKKEDQLRHYQLRMENKHYLTPLRLQAYERLILFLERITPSNLITRLKQPGMTARELQMAMISTIRVEYEHNLAQQLYISPQLWNIITHSKDDTLRMINGIASKVQKDAPAAELGRKILGYYIENEKPMPSQKALQLLKAEAKKIY